MLRRSGAHTVEITVVSLVVALFVFICAAPIAEAQRRGRARVGEVEAALAGTDRDAVRVAMENVGISGDPRLIPALAARIRRGLPPDLLDVAIDTLTVLARPEAGPVLFELATHRRAEVRHKAIEAIIACRPRGADEALVAALSDSDPTVRAAGAVGLGQLAARERVDSLFHALDRGILEASTSIGQLARPEHVTRLVGYLGQLPFDAVTPGLNEALARDDIPERVKLDVIARIAELATPEARTFLEELAASLPEERRNQGVRQAALEAAERIVR